MKQDMNDIERKNGSRHLLYLKILPALFEEKNT